MASVPTGAAVAAPAGAGAAAPAASDEKGRFIFIEYFIIQFFTHLNFIFIAAKKEEKKEESDNESDDDMGFGLFN